MRCCNITRARLWDGVGTLATTSAKRVWSRQASMTSLVALSACCATASSSRDLALLSAMDREQREALDRAKEERAAASAEAQAYGASLVDDELEDGDTHVLLRGGWRVHVRLEHDPHRHCAASERQARRREGARERDVREW